MNAPNDLNFDIETYLLFSIYYNAYQGYKNGSAAGYLQRFANEIRGAGQVLEWLGLAKPDNQSRLGWMPSNALVSLIVNPRRSKSKKDFGNAKDLEVFDMIFDATVGDDEEWSDTRIFVISVLTVLGLAKEAQFDWVPTQQLRELVCERGQKGERQRDEQHINA